MNLLIMLAVGLLLAVSIANAGPLEDGFVAYEAGGYEEAFRLWQPLADQGDAAAQFSLGVMYSDGKSVPQNHAESVKWYRKAADQGDAAAQFNLGNMYRKGLGIPQNYTEAAKWYRLAADQGLGNAQISLGLMYDTGKGVPINLVFAHMWFNLAGTQGVANAIQGRDLVEKKMTRAQLAEAQRLASEWKPKVELAEP